MYSAAVAATSDGQQTTKEGEEKVKLHTHSYCCLDYAQVYLFLLTFSLNVVLSMTFGGSIAEGRGNRYYFDCFFHNILKSVAHQILASPFIDIVMMKVVADI